MKWNKLNGTKRLESFATFNAHNAYIHSKLREKLAKYFFLWKRAKKKQFSPVVTQIPRHWFIDSWVCWQTKTNQTNHWNSLHFLFSLSKAKIDIIWWACLCTECMVYKEWSHLMFQFLLAKISQFTMLRNPYIWNMDVFLPDIQFRILKKNGFFAYGTFGT